MIYDHVSTKLCRLFMRFGQFNKVSFKLEYRVSYRAFALL
jgi:hypothetical protein